MRFALIVIAGGVALPSCASMPFIAGSMGPTAVQLDCLDVAAHSIRDSEIAGAVVELAFGNHCEHSIEVDLGKVHVRGSDETGSPVDLAAYDPEHEITALRLDAGGYGTEQIAYVPSRPLALAWLDVDVGRVEVGRAIETRWIRIHTARPTEAQ